MSEIQTKSGGYSADDIEVLEGLEPVRKRPGMYIGSTSSSGLHHLVWEIVDNGIDEALSGYGDTINVVIYKDGSISVEDHGRGIPCGIQSKYKVPAIHLIFSTLHSGGKFSNKTYSNAAGLHGVGASVTNALSEWMDIIVYRDGKIYHTRYENGGKLKVPLEIIGETKKTGTFVRFKPDKKIFSTTEFKWDTITKHLQESAFLLKGVKFTIKDERTWPYNEVSYQYNEGLKEYVAALNQNKNPIGPILTFKDFSNDIKVEIAMQYCSNDYNENIYSYANNVRTHEGGMHETGFKLGITRAVNDYANENQLLRSNNKLEGSDIREGLTAIVSVKIPEDKLEYEGQTKGKLGTPEAMAVVNNFIYTQFTYYLNENKDFATNLIQKCVASQGARLAARRAKDEARGKKLRREIILSDKLTPAQSKDYEKNELFIVEGESAGGSARKGRDSHHQAILPLRGKPLNTDSITMDKMLKNEEFATLINTIGAGVGSEFNVNDSKYGKIIIMTDADNDGAHIQTLLLTFFYHYMRPLIVAGKIYVAVPPLYRVFKDNKEQYAWRDNDLESAKNKIGRGYEISRFKGLGEMNANQLWETTMNPKNRMLIRIRIDDPLLVESRVNVLMGKDASLRRKWVEENIDFSKKDNFEDIK